MSGLPEEIEILRGPKVRVTSLIATADDKSVAVADIVDFALVEAEPKIRLAPMIFFVAGPLLGFFLFQQLGWVARALLVGMVVVATGAFLQLEGSHHQVTVRLSDKHSLTLFRTRRLGDARLFHAAIGKAMEMRVDRQ